MAKVSNTSQNFELERNYPVFYAVHGIKHAWYEHSKRISRLKAAKKQTTWDLTEPSD